MTAIATMRDILRADTTYTGIITGGVLSEPLTTDTDGAWTDPDPTTGIRTLKPTAILLDPQEVDSPFGLNPARRLDTTLFPELYTYAPRSLMAATFDAADNRAMALLHEVTDGLATITATGFRARPLEADELPGDIMQTFRRYRIELSRHLEVVT